MTREGAHIANLHGHRRGQLILNGEVAAHRVRRQILKLDSAQSQPVGVNQEWVKRRASETCLYRGTARWGRCSASSKVVDRVARIGIEEREIELERIVLTEVWRESAVFKSIVEDTENAPNNQFG